MRIITPAVLLWFLTAPAWAGSVSLSVVEDGDAFSNDNFASIIGFNTTNEAMNVDLFGTSEFRAALEFDISSLPTNPAHIVSASLVVYITISDDEIGVHGAAGDGVITESDFTFANQFTTFNPESSGFGTENVVDVTSFIQSSVGVDPLIVLQLRELFDAEENQIYSNDFFDPARRPRLDVEFVPEPASAATLAVGALTMIRRRTKKRM